VFVYVCVCERESVCVLIWMYVDDFFFFLHICRQQAAAGRRTVAKGDDQKLVEGEGPPY
jgi:RNA binding exosome subunit